MGREEIKKRLQKMVLMDVSSIVGKEVSLVEKGYFEEHIIILFKDNTFISLKTYDDNIYECDSICDPSNIDDLNILVKFKLITEEEKEILLKNKGALWQC